MLNGKVKTNIVREHAPKGKPPEFHYDSNDSREKTESGFLEDYLRLINEYVFPQLIFYCQEQYVDGLFGGRQMVHR